MLAGKVRFIMSVVFIFGVINEGLSQWVSGYTSRKELTLDGTSIVGSETNFPVLIHIASDGDLSTDARADGFDIVFSDSDGSTVLNHELISYNSGTGEYLAYVQMDLTASTDRTIFMYYDNASVSTDPSSSATWDSNYIAVLHMQESGNGTTDEFIDATGNNNHGTGGGLPGAGNNANTPNLAVGVFGSAQDFNPGNNDRIRLQTIDDDAWTAVTVQAWINPDDNGDDRLFGKCWGTGATDNTWLLRQTGGNLGTRMRTNSASNGGFDPGGGLTTGAWQLATVTWDAVDTRLRVYLNGLQVGTAGLAGATMYNPAVSDNATLGNIPGGGRAYNGQMQEARVSDIARSANWLRTQFLIESNAAAFIATKGAATSCGGTPAVGGTATAVNSSIITGTGTTINLTGNSGAIQWQSSTDNVTFTDIGGQTTSSLSTGNLTQTTYYRAVVTMSVSCTDISTTATVSVGPAFLANYCFRKLITVDAANVSGASDLTDFPLLVSLVDPDIRNVANNGQVENISGFDITFTDASNNVLDHEIESYDANSGTYVAWVKVNTLSASSNTELYMYYGNAAIVANPSATTTWDTNYKAVWHLNDSFLDATANGNDGTEGAAGSTDDIGGIIGQGRGFTGVVGGNSFITVPNDASIDTDITDQVTLEGWARYYTPVPDDSPFIVKGPAVNNERYMFGLDGSGSSTPSVNSRVTTGAGHFRYDDGAIDADWHHFVMVYDAGLGANPRLNTYVDGVLFVSNNANANILSSTNDLFIGRRNDNRRYRGALDELRVSNIARSGDWIATEYLNQYDPSGFYSISSQQSILAGGTATPTDLFVDYNLGTTVTLTNEASGATIQWQISTNNTDFTDIGGATSNSVNTGNLTQTTFLRAEVDDGSCKGYSSTATVNVREIYITDYTFRKKITIDNSKVCGNTDLANFPLLVSTTDIDLAQATGKVQDVNGHDIAFALLDGTLLNHDIEHYDGTTGEYIAWVRIPTVFVNAPTELFMYYGNCNYVGGDPSSTATYDNNYLGVYHFNEDLASTSTIDDRTSSGNNGTANAFGGADDVAAQIGTGFDFGGGQWVAMGTGAQVTGAGPRTVEMWARADAFSDERGLFQAGNPGTADFSIYTENGSNNNWVVAYEGTEDQFTINGSQGNWEHYALVYDGTDVLFYHDGILFDQTTIALNTTNTSFDVGRWDVGGIGNEFIGLIDEVKVSDIARTADWIKTEYTNQNDPANFYTFGSEKAEYHWTGANNTVNWEDDANWSFCSVPSSSADIIIPSGVTFNPELDQLRTIGFIRVETGSSVDLDGFNLVIEQDFRNDGTLTANSGTVIMNGNTTQDIYGVGTFDFHNLTVENANDIRLQQDISLTNALTLANGNVLLGDNTLSIGSSGSISGFNETRFLIADGSGQLCQDGIGATGRSGTIVFPLGTSNTSYSPVSILNAGVDDQFCVGVCNNVYNEGTCETGTIVANNVIDKTWFINETTGGGSNVTLKLQWDSNDEQASFDAADSYISHHDGSIWGKIMANATATPEGGNFFSLTATGVSSFSPFAVGSSDLSLPVDFLSFTAKSSTGNIELEWKTSSEINNDYFMVERSTDDVNFVAIGSVQGAGNSNEILTYEFIDHEPFNGENYYRLKQVDYDGQFDYSKIVSARVFRNDFLFNIYPNPTSQRNLQLVFRAIGEGPLELSITNVSGVAVHTNKVLAKVDGTTSCDIQLDKNLPAGIYIVSVKSGNNTYKKKLIIAE